MPHTIFDERGGILLQTDSDLKAFTFALTRQAQSGKLTTMLYGGEAEVLFAPNTPGFENAKPEFATLGNTAEHDIAVARARRNAAPPDLEHGREAAKPAAQIIEAVAEEMGKPAPFPHSPGFK